MVVFKVVENRLPKWCETSELKFQDVFQIFQPLATEKLILVPVLVCVSF